MNYYSNDKAESTERGVTMQNLKEELYSLNMRILLAMQYHDDDTQAELESQMQVVQAKMKGLNMRV